MPVKIIDSFLESFHTEQSSKLKEDSFDYSGMVTIFKQNTFLCYKNKRMGDLEFYRQPFVPKS